MKRFTLSFVLLGSLLLTEAASGQGVLAKVPAVKVIQLDTQGKDYLPLLGGPPETVTMRSGLVVLAPGKSVGKHSTGTYEEVLVVLEGAGRMVITGGETLPVVAGTAVYCPPQREHDVHNTGQGDLRYVYIVAKARL
ncbi:MAG: cupin domain-containing protein [Geothrix sp.]